MTLIVPAAVYHTPPHFFFFNHTATTEIYTLSLHDALPILDDVAGEYPRAVRAGAVADATRMQVLARQLQDRKSTRLNSSHSQISYAVFCLKKKKRRKNKIYRRRISVKRNI